MTWEISAVVASGIVPFFFVYLGGKFEPRDVDVTRNPAGSAIFVMLKVACYIVALFSINMILMLTSLIVEESASASVGTIDALAMLARGAWFITLPIIFLLVLWYVFGMVTNIIQGRS